MNVRPPGLVGAEREEPPRTGRPRRARRASAPARAASSWATGSAPGVSDRRASPPRRGQQAGQDERGLAAARRPQDRQEGVLRRGAPRAARRAPRGRRRTRGRRAGRATGRGTAGGRRTAAASAPRASAGEAEVGHLGAEPRRSPRGPLAVAPGASGLSAGRSAPRRAAHDRAAAAKRRPQDRGPVGQQRLEAVEAVADLGRRQGPVERIAEQRPAAQAAVQGGHRASGRPASPALASTSARSTSPCSRRRR